MQNDEEEDLPEEFIGLRDKIIKFMHVAKSNDLLYNFDTDEIIVNPQIRKRLDNGEIGIAIFNPKKKPVPIFGDYVRAKNHWFPLMHRYQKYLDDLHERKLHNLFSLPIDIFILMIKRGKLKAKDVINSCSVNKHANAYCKKYENQIYRALIELEYSNSVAEIIPRGLERSYYLELVEYGLEHFWEKNIDRADWRELSGNPNISERFFERHIDKVDWRELSGNPNISEEFVESFLHKVNWDTLSGNPNISERFFERYLHKVNWRELSRNPNLSQTFRNRYFDKLN